MPQELQEEAEPQKDPMDQSFQKIIRKGADCGELLIYRARPLCLWFDLLVGYLPTKRSVF